MTYIAVPREICAQISQRAMQLAREDVQSRGWSSQSAILAFPDEGQVGLRTTAKHIMYQNRGIRPFIMWWAEGRTIPIRDADGVHFVRAKGVGTPGWVTLPGGVRKWRDQRWRHPGLKPKNFLENAISRAVAEYRPQFREMLMNSLNGGRQHVQR